MDWNALIGALIGAGIPATLVYVGLHRQSQSADAEAFGRAVLLLDRVNPDRLTINLNPDAAAEANLLADMQRQIDVARERLLAHGRLVRPDNLRFPALANNRLALAPPVLCPRRAAWALTVKEAVEGSL